MPSYEDGKYQATYIGNMHPVKVMDGDKVIVEAPLQQQTGTLLSWANTYNDRVEGLMASGLSQQVQTVQGNNVLDVYKWSTSANAVSGWPTTVNPGDYVFKPIGIGSFKYHGWANTIATNSWIVKNLLPNTTYYFKCTITLTRAHDTGYDTLYDDKKSLLLYSGVGGYASYYFTYNDSTFVEGQSAEMSRTFTTPSNLLDAGANYRIIGCSERWLDSSGNPGYSTVTFSNMMLSKVDVAYAPFVPNSPSPDYQAPMPSVNGDLIGCGKNLFDSNAVYSYARCTKLSNASIQSNVVNSYYANLLSTSILPVIFFTNQGRTFTFSVDHILADRRCSIVIYGTRSNGATYQGATGVTGQRYVTITVAADFLSISSVELRFNGKNTTFTDTDSIFSNFQLELGSVATSYKPYVGQTAFSLSNLRGIPAAGVYDTYEPRVMVDGVWRSRKIQRIWEKVFDGTEGWVLDSYNNLTLTGTGILKNSDQVCVVSNALKGVEYNKRGLSSVPRIHAASAADTNFILQVRGVEQTTVAQWKSLLAAQYAAGTPVIVDYVLATPIVTLGDPVDIPSYFGQTNIISTSAVQGQLSASVRVQRLN